MPNLNTIFEGVTTSPAREFLALCATSPSQKFKRIYMPAAGRFGSTMAIAKAGYPASSIYTSDVTLFSSLLGYLCDPSKDIDELQIKIQPDEPEAQFVRNAKDIYEWAAGILLAIKRTRTAKTNGYEISIRQEMMVNQAGYIAHITDRVKALVDILRGMHYDIADLRDVGKEALASEDTDTMLSVDLPVAKGDYAKMFAEADRVIHWAKPELTMFEPGESVPYLRQFEGARCWIIAHRRDPKGIPPNWPILFVSEQKRDKHEWLVANRDIDHRHASTALIVRNPPHLYPVYDDQEITPTTRVDLIPVKHETAMYYRDLFVHRLGTVNAENYYLLLLDGRVTTSFGLYLSDVYSQKSRYLAEVFGCTLTSTRYPRLSKLATLLLVSKDTNEMLLATNRALHLREPLGMQITTVTRHGKGTMTDRGVMKTVSVTPLPHGQGYKILNRTDWHPRTWAETIDWWLRKWGKPLREADPVIEVEAAQGDTDEPSHS